MPSERVQRRIDRLLDEAEQAMDAGNWPQVRSLARHVLDLDPDNADALTFVDVAERRSAAGATGSSLDLLSPAGECAGAGLRRTDAAQRAGARVRRPPPPSGRGRATSGSVRARRRCEGRGLGGDSMSGVPVLIGVLRTGSSTTGSSEWFRGG